MDTTWSDLCRCCLSPFTQMSLFDSENNVKEKFYEITNIEAKVDDELPQKLCSDCYNKLNSAYEFRKQCIKMDSELKVELQVLLNQAVVEAQEFQKDIRKQDKDFSDDDDIATNPLKQLASIIKAEPVQTVDEVDNLNAREEDSLKQLESIIKTEAIDNDDDYYYVLVIDDKQEEEKITAVNKSTTAGNIKTEQISEENNQTEKDFSVQENFASSIDSFLVSDTRIPINVPATILENEEENPEQEDQLDNVMDIEIIQGNPNDEHSEEQNLLEVQGSQDNIGDIIKTLTGEIVTDNDSGNSYIKILGADGTILLQNSDQITYLSGSELVPNEDSNSLSQEEIILCEGDDTSQFQVLKCDSGAELVIEYANDGTISTVLQKEDGNYVCECGEKFQDRDEYEKHQRKHNPGEEHLCNLCGKGFESEEILIGHSILHNVTGLLIVCPFCNQIVKRNTLTQHIKYAHSNIKPQCEICQKTFANPNNLKRHMMIHSGVKEFECDICFKRFHQKITMQTHRITHINPFSCNECDEVFLNKEALTSHKETNQCSKSKVNKIKQELMNTIKQKITTNLGNIIGHACSLCKKMFSVESALEQHIESMHIIDPSELVCSECNEVFPSKKQLQSHILNHKSIKSKNTKRFECKLCNKGCASQAMLLMHERVHTNERPFPCNLCSLRFKTKTHLRTHQLTHTREKKFGCSVCMKFFALKGNLVVHLRTHTGERPYICSLCGEAFIDSKYLKKHKLKKHSIGNVPWNQY